MLDTAVEPLAHAHAFPFLSSDEDSNEITDSDGRTVLVKQAAGRKR